MKMIKVGDIKILDFPKIEDDRGNLSFLESSNQIPFDIERLYFIYDVPGGAIRGGHAYQELNEVIIALSGSFDVVVNDGKNEKKISLNRSYYGLYVPNGLWRQLENFSTNALCLIVADKNYNEADYIRDFQDYKLFNNAQA